MGDVGFVLLALGLFALSALYVRVCAWLVSDRHGDEEAGS